MNRIGVFLPNWIGDVVMATPTLRALRQKWPDAELVGIHRPYISDVLAGTTLLDRSIIHDRKGSDPQRRGLAFVKTLRQEKFDLVLLLTNSLRTGWLAWLSGASERVGFDNDGRGWMLTDAVPGFDRKIVKSALDNYLELAERVGCSIDSKQTELATTEEDERRWHEFVIRKGNTLETHPFVALNPGGAFGEAKHWPSDHFAELAKKIVDRYDREVIVLCGPSELDTAKKIVRLSGSDRVTSLADGQVSIGLSKATVKHAELLVTTDSGPRHFAQPFGTPVITLFGPTHIEYSETYYENATHLQLDLDCGPCQQRTCPLGHLNCMRDLSVEQVFRAVSQLIEGHCTKAA